MSLTPGGIYFPDGGDVPDVPADMEALALSIEAKLDTMRGMVEIGGMYPYAGDADPPSGDALLADGRLIDQATYPAFFARVGHRYNNNVDPGGGKVRIPDKRGRGSFGADSFGTAAGAAGRRTTSHLQGNSGGTEKHTLALTEMPSHTHTVKTTHDTAYGPGNWGIATSGNAEQSASTGGGLPHNNMPPHETDYWLVRVK